MAALFAVLLRGVREVSMAALPDVNPAKYDGLLATKVAEVTELFAEFDIPEVEVFASEPNHYRLRAEFRTWHEDDDLFYIMFQKGSKHDWEKVEDCPMVAKPIYDVMFVLLDRIKGEPELRHRLFQVDFLSTLSGELLVSLLYHRQLTDAWDEHAKALESEFGIHVVGRARKQKKVMSRDFVIEKMPVNDQVFTYKQIENAFSQPNGKVCGNMLEWALEATANTGGDLVELYCGNGNFTIALAQNFGRVVATEISKSSVHAAQYNIEANGIDNIDVVRISSEEFSQVLAGKLEKRRTKDLKLETCDFKTVLVDPPRAGLDDDTVQQVQCYDNILYISCNPETLQENLKVICETHKVERFAMFDQFPYTHHVECGVYLSRR